MLPQLVVLGTAGAGVWLAMRWMRTEVARVDGEIRRAERSLERLRSAPVAQLRFDPETGHYRPAEQ